MSNLHVVKNGQNWALKQEHNPYPVFTAKTQSEIIDSGTSLAIAYQVELLIHGRDGKIRERNSFGNDPFPPRG